MGRTLDQWRARVLSIVRDQAGVDVSATEVDETGLYPAFSEHSNRDPRETVSELVGTGSAYLDLPEEWERHFSTVVDVEYPARETYRQVLKRSEWSLRRSIDDVGVEQLWLCRAPSATEYVRLRYLTSWPLPTEDADVDQIPAAKFEALCTLAAAYVCESLANQAARGRDGAIPSDLVAGEDRRLMLSQAADRLRQRYADLAYPFCGIA